VIALSNASGQLTDIYAYLAYGSQSGYGADTAAYRFTGRRYDPETGLHFYRARAYSSALGRFLQADPIGTDGGINLCAYVANDPANGVDQTGWQRDPSGSTLESNQAALANAMAAGAAMASGGGESNAAAYGREAHRTYGPGSNYTLNQTILGSDSPIRPDAVDYENGIVRELKPDNPRAIRQAERQLNSYLEELQNTGDRRR
jgi:RHS repeat-associated protein